MIGKVTFYDGKKGRGYIAGEDGRNYFVDKSNVNTVSHNLTKGYMVMFMPSKNNHGYEAEDVVIY